MGDGTVWKYEGNFREPGDEINPGSLWIENDEFRYVDEDHRVRALTDVDGGGPVPGEKGSVWIESSKINYVDTKGKRVVTTAANQEEVMEGAHTDEHFEYDSDERQLEDDL
ncbi:hypothetical protein C483_12318 [Natrialba hulunbeirensis JCM 10989]|uniref:Uncharacterized protein n=1 Tax=Natrialba hulunbeirensis JCM 10989 TaxID=1227493 RepID=L9ZVC0_9EURY|nr:hypothetical protein C483_12318 [Natrialba hulunbeirensis JCM 10989]